MADKYIIYGEPTMYNTLDALLKSVKDDKIPHDSRVMIVTEDGNTSWSNVVELLKSVSQWPYGSYKNEQD